MWLINKGMSIIENIKGKKMRMIKIDRRNFLKQRHLEIKEQKI